MPLAPSSVPVLHVARRESHRLQRERRPKKTRTRVRSRQARLEIAFFQGSCGLANGAAPEIIGFCCSLAISRQTPGDLRLSHMASRLGRGSLNLHHHRQQSPSPGTTVHTLTFLCVPCSQIIHPRRRPFPRIISSRSAMTFYFGLGVYQSPKI